MSVCILVDVYTPVSMIYNNRDLKYNFGKFCGAFGLSIQGEFSSVAQSCPTLGNPMDCSMPGFPELAQTHVHQVGDAIQPSHPLSFFSFCLQSFPESGSFPMSWLFASGGQSIRVSSSASVPPMNTQD